MNKDNIIYCVVALFLGMLLANMLKNVCGCNVEGLWVEDFENVGKQCKSENSPCCTGSTECERIKWCSECKRAGGSGCSWRPGGPCPDCPDP